MARPEPGKAVALSCLARHARAGPALMTERAGAIRQCLPEPVAVEDRERVTDLEAGGPTLHV